MTTHALLMSFPKRDVLDETTIIRPAQSLPAKHLPAWTRLPLSSKLPYAWDSINPVILSRGKLGEKIFKKYPHKAFDLKDAHNRFIPKNHLDLHDPTTKQHFNYEQYLRNLKKRGLITKQEDVVCTYKDFHDYRSYLRYLMALEEDQKRQPKDDFDYSKNERDELIKKRKHKENWNRIHVGMHRWVNNMLDNVTMRSLKKQREKDLLVINNEIRLAIERKEKAVKFEARFRPKYEKHIEKKYGGEERRKKIHEDFLKKDIAHVKSLIDKKENIRRAKMEAAGDWWNRKAEVEKEWLVKEDELKKERAESSRKNVEFMKETHRYPKPGEILKKERKEKLELDIFTNIIEGLINQTEISTTCDEVVQSVMDKVEEMEIFGQDSSLSLEANLIDTIVTKFMDDLIARVEMLTSTEEKSIPEEVSAVETVQQKNSDVPDEIDEYKKS